MLTKFVTAEIANQPGEVGKAARCLAEANVNIEAYAYEGTRVRFLASDPAAAERCLKGKGYATRTVDVFELELPNQPGQLAAVGEALGRAGVNIESSFGLGVGEAARVFIRVNDVAKATQILERLAGARTATRAR